MDKRLDTDIAVLEQHYGEEIRVLAYIGPDRPAVDVYIGFNYLHEGGSIRLRYLKRAPVLEEEAHW